VHLFGQKETKWGNPVSNSMFPIFASACNTRFAGAQGPGKWNIYEWGCHLMSHRSARL
jgi:hypothetical protein